MKRHYCDINDDIQKITVSVIGAGGTGSLLLQQLGRMNKGLISLGSKGLHVRCFDHDTISKSNVWRQLFLEGDIGRNKAECIISKVNTYYGFDWEAYPVKIKKDSPYCLSNITIICVDNFDARKNIYKTNPMNGGYEFKAKYIIDCGNSQFDGQVYLSTVLASDQPKSSFETVAVIKNPLQEYGKNIYKTEDTNVPSCSLAEAINNQDLMINQFVADFAAKMIWDMVRFKYIDYSAMFINLETMFFSKKQL